MKRTISYSDERVVEALKRVKNASKFFEDAAIYYLESIEEEKINRSTVKDIVLDCLKGMVTQASGPITNQNYMDTIDIMDEDIDFIRGLGE